MLQRQDTDGGSSISAFKSLKLVSISGDIPTDGHIPVKGQYPPTYLACLCVDIYKKGCNQTIVDLVL